MTAHSAGLEQRARELLAREYKGDADSQTRILRGHLDDGPAIRAIIAALAAAPAADGWIAVSDRLPTGWEHVEVFPDPRDREHIYYAPIDGGTNGVKAGRWYLNDASGYDNEIRVTHWRTPAAPQAQGEG